MDYYKTKVSYPYLESLVYLLKNKTVSHIEIMIALFNLSITSKIYYCITKLNHQIYSYG